MKPKKFNKPAVIRHPIESQEGCTLLITVESFADCRRYRRLIPELVRRDVIHKRPDLVKDLLFKNFRTIHVAKE
jgi:hypothetical protein